jgi:hypothetical protein
MASSSPRHVLRGVLEPGDGGDRELATVRRVRQRFWVGRAGGRAEQWCEQVYGRVTVYDGTGGRGSTGLEVCLAPEALVRLVADDEFINQEFKTD